MWRWFSDGALLPRIVNALVDPFRGDGISRVAALESRGFLLAGAAAVELGAGVSAIRKVGSFPGAR